MSSRPSPTSIERARTPSPPIFHLHRRPTTPGRRVTTPDLSISIPSQLPNNNQLLSPNISNYPSVPLTPRRSISSDRKGSWPPPGGETKKRMKDEAWTVLKGVREALVGAVCALGLVNMVLNLMFLIQGKVFYSSYLGPNVELLVASIVTLATLSPLHYYFRPSSPSHLFSALITELLLLAALFLLFLGGSSSITSMLPQLGRCRGFTLCDQARVLKILGWTQTSVLGGTVAVVALKGVLEGGWKEEFEGSRRGGNGRGESVTPDSMMKEKGRE